MMGDRMICPGRVPYQSGGRNVCPSRITPALQSITRRTAGETRYDGPPFPPVDLMVLPPMVLPNASRPMPHRTELIILSPIIR